jgi:hypothetical protein
MIMVIDFSAFVWVVYEHFEWEIEIKRENLYYAFEVLHLKLKRGSMKKPDIAKTWWSTDFESDPIGS